MRFSMGGGFPVKYPLKTLQIRLGSSICKPSTNSGSLVMNLRFASGCCRNSLGSSKWFFRTVPEIGSWYWLLLETNLGLLPLFWMSSMISASSSSLLMCLYLQKARLHVPFRNKLQTGCIPGSWFFLVASARIWLDISPLFLYSSTSSVAQWINL